MVQDSIKYLEVARKNKCTHYITVLINQKKKYNPSIEFQNYWVIKAFSDGFDQRITNPNPWPSNFLNSNRFPNFMLRFKPMTFKFKDIHKCMCEYIICYGMPISFCFALFQGFLAIWTYDLQIWSFPKFTPKCRNLWGVKISTFYSISYCFWDFLQIC